MFVLRLWTQNSENNAISGKQKDKAQKETLAVSATMLTNVDKQSNAIVLSCSKTTDSKRRERFFEKKSSQRP